MEEKKTGESAEDANRQSSEFSEKIEEKIEQAAREFKEKAKEIGERIEKEFKSEAGERGRHDPKHRPHRSANFWGAVLIIIGFLFLAENLRWIDWDIPFWPIVLIVVGAYIIYDQKRHD